MEIICKDEKEKEEEDEDGFELKTSLKKKGIRKHEHCFIRKIFSRFGSYYIYEKQGKKIFASKIKIINFTMKKDLFEKGKINYLKGKSNINLPNSIPEIKFWFN